MTTTIYLTTPCFNAADTIDQTILSIFSQAGDFRIRYHVQDGGSTDTTIERLIRWKDRLQRGDVNIFCEGIDFSYASENDSGMYDAITRGFKYLQAPSDAWISWINADDLIAPGAFALLREIDIQLASDSISWITGSTSIAWNGLTVGWGERPVCSKIIAAGLCDGHHWSFIQQEGTFFRQWLWEASSSASPFDGFKLAGDWNLWRIFAERADIYQIPWATGTFCRREGQLSQKHRDAYMQEIANIVSTSERKTRLLALQNCTLTRNQLQTKFVDRSIAVHRYGMSLEPWLAKVIAGQSVGKVQAIDNIVETATNNIVIEPGLIAYNEQWQYPAITEQHAFIKVRQFIPRMDSSICYFGFPWATLIDHIQANGGAVDALKKHLYSFKDDLAKYRRIVTTCQHIYLPRFIELFEDLGVTDIFWSHAVKGQPFLEGVGRITIHPFPLFPVQAIDGVPKSILKNMYLFSFVGAKANSGYLSCARNHILDYLSSHSLSYVQGRDAWHFEKIVYDHQVFKKNMAKESLVDTENTDEYRKILYSSVFSLCPSGSGPNSIRLWESIVAGVIPVVLADSYLPPVESALWDEATVSCKESLPDILSLPDRLAQIASDDNLLRRKRHALRQIALLYGPEYFVYDIHRLFIGVLAGDKTYTSFNRSLLRQGDGNLKLMAEVLTSSDGTDEPRAMRAFMYACVTRVITDSVAFLEILEMESSIRTALRVAMKKTDDVTRNLFIRSIELRGISLSQVTR